MGINIVVKLTPAQGNYTFAIVAIEYFTKWIEAKTATNISSETMKKFFYKTTSAASVCQEKSWLTMPNNLTMTCLMISAIKLG
jgi:hypothetical protein